MEKDWRGGKGQEAQRAVSYCHGVLGEGVAQGSGYRNGWRARESAVSHPEVKSCQGPLTWLQVDKR